MDKATIQSLEAAGFRIGDAEDFLELSDEERRMVALRVAISRAVRSLRETQKLTQKQLADKMKSSQSRVAKIEACAPGVSLDLMFSGLFALGGKLEDLSAKRRRKRAKRASARAG
jgi:predicted XRE-type DNA-binding protein